MSADTEASIIKKNILDYFGIILGCDNVLGCEYLLLLLISRIYSRQLGFVDIQNLGNLKMNISLESTFDVEQVSQFVRLLFAHLQNVIPAVQLLDIHIESLENNTYIPLFGREAEISENYFLQDLLPTSGSLMVSPGTLFLLDETRMNPGKLKENGVNNFQALRTCIDKQILEVPFSDDFSVPVFIDNPIISISLNGKSLSNPNAKGFKVALQEVHNYEEKLASFLKQVPEFYHRARGYFRKSACIIETKFTESLLESIEKNFVARRQIVESDFEKNDAIESDYLTMTAELLHQELILTK